MPYRADRPTGVSSRNRDGLWPLSSEAHPRLTDGEIDMTFGNATRALLLSALLAAPAALVQAQTQTPARIKPGEPAISMDDARRIAKEHGLVRVEEINLDDGKWEIEGRDSTGAEIEIDLRATDGTVIKMERDRPASAGVRP